MAVHPDYIPTTSRLHPVYIPVHLGYIRTTSRYILATSEPHPGTSWLHPGYILMHPSTPWYILLHPMGIWGHLGDILVHRGRLLGRKSSLFGIILAARQARDPGHHGQGVAAEHRGRSIGGTLPAGRAPGSGCIPSRARVHPAGARVHPGRGRVHRAQG